MCIDTPSEDNQPVNVKENTVNISGWIMSTDSKSTLEVYLDNENQNAKIERVAREDVLNIIKGYGGKTSNPLPGFETTINISKCKSGIHTIKYVLKDADGNVILERTQKINFMKGRFCIDVPNEDMWTKNIRLGSFC